MQWTSSKKGLIRAGMFLGGGLGGMVDGIILHQILQLHAMLSAKVPKTSVVNLEVNMFWDGMFLAGTWTLTLVGLVLLWRAIVKERVMLSTKCFVGSMLMGFGIFNFVEGLINHHVLHLHHVVEQLGVSIFDYAFLASGVILFLAGWRLVSASKKDVNLLTAGLAQPSPI